MAKIGLIKPSDSDYVSLTDINSNWTKIETAFGELGTPSATNNVLTAIQDSADDLTAAMQRGSLMFDNWAKNGAASWELAVNGIGTTAVATEAKTNMIAYLNLIDSTVVPGMSDASVSLKIVSVASSNRGLAAIYKVSNNVYTALCIPLNNSFIYLARKLAATSFSVRIIS